MIKKLLSSILCFILLTFQNLPIHAQTFKIPAGTPITIYVDKEIDADDVRIYQNINFIVRDI